MAYRDGWGVPGGAWGVLDEGLPRWPGVSADREATPGAVIRNLLDYWESHPNEDWITTRRWLGGSAHEDEARGSFVAFSGSPSRLSEIENGCSRRGLRFAASALKRSVDDFTGGRGGVTA